MELSRARRADEAKVLIVEDEPRLRDLLIRAVQAAGFTAEAVWSGEEAVRLNRQQPFDIVILDYHLPQMDGLQTLQKLRETAPDLQAIVLTGHASLDVAREAMHLDVLEFLIKPCPRGELEQALDRALKRRQKAAPQPLDVPSENANPTQPPVTLEDAEREMILHSLRRHNGNRAAAARELGITRRTLHNKINTYQDQGFAVP
ncbi:MAG TPA: response regulator [Humisphaera sp.]|jgi:DNA-binding NtrC family response regulator|nr:response regulator [Humisphaera sp.]